MSKVCSSCNEDKTLEHFGTYKGRNGAIKVRAECKACRVVREGKRNKDNPERHSKYNAKWKANNKEHVKEYAKNRMCYKRLVDCNFKLKTDLVSHIRHLIYGDRKTLSCLQCSREQLKVWFEYQFDENLSWVKYDEWQVDHVIPLSFFDLTNEMEYMLACNWSNMRPVKADVNQAKSDSIDKDTILQHMDRIVKFLENHNGYQADLATSWWQRFSLWYGKNAQDDREFETLLKWIIRNDVPCDEESAQRLNGSGCCEKSNA